MMSNRELDVLNVLFHAEKPVGVGEIVKKSGSLTQSTTSAIIRSMLNKGYVELAGSAWSGNVPCRIYSPTEKAKEAILEHMVDLYGRCCNVFTIAELMEYLDRREGAAQ